MKFQIRNDRLDPGEWGTVNKLEQWQILKTGIAEKTEGVVEAVQEMYAVVKADVTEALTPADVWGPHHTLRQDGTLVLSRSGMMVATAALVGARTGPDLTSEQEAAAARHLLRHYHQENVNLQPPQLLIDLAGAGEVATLDAAISGEMRTSEVPVSAKIDIVALKTGDDDPMEIVVEIPTGKSTRGWNYTDKALQRIVGEVLKQGLPGFLGHQKPDEVDSRFPTPVTHWVGAKYENGKAYFRGVVDKSAVDLKRWLRAGTVKTVSIFGIPSLQTVGGETQVVDYQPLSIDWTPLGRAGMKTRIVAKGEISRGGEEMTLAELLGELRKLGVKPAQVVGEMGWDVKMLAKEMGWELDKIAGEVNAERWNQLLEAVRVVGEMAEVFGLTKEAKLSELVTMVKAAREAQLKAATAEHDKLVDKVIGEMVQAEAARPLVKRMLQIDAAADEVAIKKVVGEMLAQEDIKKALAEVFKADPITPKTSPQVSGSGSNIIKRVRI